MSFVPMTTLLRHAQDHHYAVGYFEAWNLESLLAVVDAAEDLNSPIIIGFSGMFVDNPARRRPEDICHYGALGKRVAERAKVPVALLLNEAERLPILVRGLKAGFNAVMYVKEHAALEHLVEVNKYLVQTAHYCEAAVEAELGELPTADVATGKMSAGSLTDPDQAAWFVKETGVDALAVAIGNVHLLEGAKSGVDFKLLQELRRKVPVPLVLHGGTGVAPADFAKAIDLGIAKVNVGTVLKRVFINTLKQQLGADVSKVDPHELIGKGGPADVLMAAREAMSREVAGFLRRFGSENQAFKV